MKRMLFGVMHFIRWHKILSLLLVLCLLCGAALAHAEYAPKQQQEETVLLPAPETAPLQRMDLHHSITANGVIQSHSVQNVYSTLSHAVASIHVRVGDKVSVGQVLCQLDTSELDLDIGEAQRAIESAQASDALKLSQAQRKLAAAEEQLSYDGFRLEKALETTLQELEAAHLVDATHTANTLVSTDAYKKAESDFLQAEYDLSQVPMMDLNNPSEPSEIYLLVKAAYDNAVAIYDSAALAYQEAWDNAYQTALETGIPSPETENHRKAIENQETTLRNGQLAIASAQDAVNTCQLTDSALAMRGKLERLEIERRTATITAPLSGTVTAIGAQKGCVPGGNADEPTASLFTIQDAANLSVQATVSEHDATLLQMDMPVNITATALKGQRWNGSLTSISPAANDDTNSFAITVKLASEPGMLTLGMSAHLAIPIENRRHVFAVPSTAIGKNAQGRNVVFEAVKEAAASETVAQDPPASRFQLREILVNTGIITATYTEISASELREGMPIVLTPPQQSNSSA